MCSVLTFGCKFPSSDFFTYHDALIVCDEPQMTDDEFDTILNPAVIVEILSNTTQRYYRGDKFAFYRSIPSLKGFILISSLKVAVEHHQRQPNNSWLLEETWNKEDSLTISFIGFSLPLSEIYAGVKFKE